MPQPSRAPRRRAARRAAPVVGRAEGIDSSEGDASRSCIEPRVADATQRPVWVAFQAAAQQASERAGRVTGQSLPVGWLAEDGRKLFVMSSPRELELRGAAEHFEQDEPNAQTLAAPIGLVPRAVRSHVKVAC